MLVAGFVQPRYGWRAVFFVGILPAFFALWVQRQRAGTGDLEGQRRTGPTEAARFSSIFKSGIGRLTVVLTLMNTCTLFAWWGFNLWLPSYLKSPPAQGGAGLGAATTTTFLFVMQAGMWFGYVTFGFISDRFGRKKSYVAYLLSAAVLLAVYVTVRDPTLLLDARPVRRLRGDRLLQRLRRRDGGGLPDVDSRHRAGLHLQHRPRRERRGAVPGRHARRHARLRRRAARLFGGVRRRRGASGSGSRRREGGRSHEAR